MNENENESDDGQYYLEQIVLKKIPDLNDCWYTEYYEDNKETNLRLFKLKLAHALNDVNDNLFKEIFGFTSVELVDTLINVTSKKIIRCLLIILK